MTTTAIATAKNGKPGGPVLLCLALLFFQLNYLLSTMGVSGYALGGLCLVLFTLLAPWSFRGRPELLSAILLLATSGYLYLVRSGFEPGAGALEALTAVVVIPLLGVISVITRTERVFVAKFVSWCAVIGIAGMLMQRIGVPAPFLVEELSAAGDLIYTRGTSLYGGSLSYAGMALAQFCCALYVCSHSRQKRWRILAAVAFVEMLDSSSRRVWVPAMLLLAIYVAPKLFRLSLLKAVAAVAAMLSVLTVAMLLWPEILFRMLSIVDFRLDDSNVARLDLISAGFDLAVQNPTGLGPGLLSSIGKSKEFLAENPVAVTESYYMSVAAEFGIVFVLPAFVLAAIAYAKLERLRRHLFLLPFAIEAVMGLSLFIPYVICIVAFVGCSADPSKFKSPKHGPRSAAKVRP